MKAGCDLVNSVGDEASWDHGESVLEGPGGITLLKERTPHCTPYYVIRYWRLEFITGPLRDI